MCNVVQISLLGHIFGWAILIKYTKIQQLLYNFNMLAKFSEVS